MKTKAFTFIELLIVVAIIGILSSVTLGALSKSRDKAQDAKIKAELAQLKSSAEIFNDQSGHYGPETNSCAEVGSFFASSEAVALIATAETASGVTSVATCASDNGFAGVGNASSWAISVPLRSDPLINWCIDSAGTATEATAQISATTNTAFCL